MSLVGPRERWLASPTDLHWRGQLAEGRRARGRRYRAGGGGAQPAAGAADAGLRSVPDLRSPAGRAVPHTGRAAASRRQRPHVSRPQAEPPTPAAPESGAERAMSQKLIAIIAAAVLACGCTAATAATPASARVRPSCATVTFGWKTATGSEADAPVTVCGAGLHHDLICQLNTPGIAPGSIADCFRPR